MTRAQGWWAPTAQIPVRGRVRLPGSPAATLTGLRAAASGRVAVLLTDPAHTPVTLAACDAVRATGAAVVPTPEGDWLVVPAGRAVGEPRTRAVAPDPAVAAGFLAAAAVTTGTVVVRNWPADGSDGSGPSGVPDGWNPGDADRVRGVLADLGTYVVRSSDGLTCTSRSTSGELSGVRADLRGMPAQVPVFAVLAASAQGSSEFAVDDGPLVRACVTALGGLGGRVGTAGGVLRVQPGPLTGGAWLTAGHPALALAGAVLGLRVPGVVVDDVGSLAAVLPGFTDLWVRLMWADEHLLPGTGAGEELRR